ncbi:MAG TPA: hypothetical protein VJY15_19900, partial [Candidatus Acidoferrum sp.]|nr:hypothetical protein [Candidatus Acidoferrum sp.]
AHALVTSHSLTLKSLSQQTVYTYEVQSTDSGGSTTSSTSTFALCNPGNPNSGFTTVTAGENAGYVTGTVTGTWTDNSGVSTSSPTVCGTTFSTTPTASVGLPGNLVMLVPDNNYIIPSPSSWIFTQSNASGLGANEQVNGATIDFTSAFGLQASPSGSGSYTWFGNTMNPLTALVDPTNVVDAAGNGLFYNANLISIGDFTGDSCAFFPLTSAGALECFDVAGDSLQLGNPNGVILTDAAGDSCTLNAGAFNCTIGTDVWSQTASGVVYDSATGGAQGTGTFNVKGCFVNGVACLTAIPLPYLIGSAFNTTQYTNATTGLTTIVTSPSIAAGWLVYVACQGDYEITGTAETIGIALTASQTAQNMDYGAFINYSAAAGVGSVGFTGTSTTGGTAISGGGVVGSTSAVYPFSISGRILWNATTSGTVALQAETGNALGTVTINAYNTSCLFTRLQ